jgi:hypothetical protein
MKDGMLDLCGRMGIDVTDKVMIKLRREEMRVPSGGMAWWGGVGKGLAFSNVPALVLCFHFGTKVGMKR